MTTNVLSQNDHDHNDDYVMESTEIQSRTNRNETGDAIDAQRSGVEEDHLSESENVHVNDDNYDEDHDEMIYKVDSNDSTIPVGITIAYKRYEAMDISADETMHPSPTKHQSTGNIHNASGTWKAAKRIKSLTMSGGRNSSNNNNNNITRKYRNSKKTSKLPAHKSLQVLLDSSLIYIFCMIIPPILAFVYHNIIQEITWESIRSFFSNDREGFTSASSSTSFITNPKNDALPYSYYSLLDPLFEYLNEYPSYQYVKSTIYEPTIHYMCSPNTNYDAVSSTTGSSAGTYSYYTSYFWTTVLEQTGICPPEYAQLRLQLRRRSVISDDMSIYMDVFYVTICSLLLAMVRMTIVHYTIFKSSGDTVQAATSNLNDTNKSMTMSNVDALTVLVRCKSNHLLSSDYHNVISTPDHSSHTRRVKKMSSDAISQCLVTRLNEATETDAHASSGSDASRKVNTTEDDVHNSIKETFGYMVDVSDRDLQPEDEDHSSDSINNENTTIIRMNPLIVGNTVGNLLSVENMDPTTISPHEETPYQCHDKLEEEEQQHQQQQREYRKLMYAAPRYATAIFRLLYCTITAGIALMYFRHADFWPWFVLGTGRGTKQCWDLSGGITVGGMDSDFDQHNAVLKRYFLWQASYHIHSSTFHFLLSMVFLFYPFIMSNASTDNGDNTESILSSPYKRLRGIKRGSDAYVRSFIQHLLSVVLIAVAYTFSSLRRLGAIGLFAFDVSSWSLHLLQICINAPDDSYVWRLLPSKYQNEKGSFVHGLYLFVVVPSFIVARFVIWPALWYSVAFESQSWLKQLEMTLWPGSALLLCIIMHTLMLILHCISLLYLYRLLYHRLFTN